MTDKRFQIQIVRVDKRLTVTVLCLECDLLAHKLYATRRVSTPRLRIQCLAPIRPKPLHQRSPCAGNIVGRTVAVPFKITFNTSLTNLSLHSRMSSGIVRIEIFVDVEDKISDATIRVFDCAEGWINEHEDNDRCMSRIQTHQRQNRRRRTIRHWSSHSRAGGSFATLH